jgi:hypothetical protein
VRPGHTSLGIFGGDIAPKDCSNSGLIQATCRTTDGACCGKTSKRGNSKTCVP